MGIRQRKRGNSLSMLILNIVLICAIIVNGTYAWIHIGQSVNGALLYLNEEYEVILEKYEKDSAGNIVLDEHGEPIPMENVGFALFITANDKDEQIGDIRYTDEDGRIYATVPVGNFYFQEIYYPSGFGPDTDENGENILRYDFTITGDVLVEDELDEDGELETVEETDIEVVDETDIEVVDETDMEVVDETDMEVVNDDSEDEPLIITVYNKPLDTSLDVEKIVENLDGTELTQAQLEQEFEFTVIIGDENTYSYYIKNEDGSDASNNISNIAEETVTEEINEGLSLATEYIEEIEQGVFTTKLSNVLTYTYSDTIDIEYAGDITSGDKIYLKHGQVAVIEGVPMETYYQVTETRSANYYTRTENVSGNITFGANKAKFVNIYDDVNGRLRVTKEVQGDGFDPDKEFEFTATIGEGDSQKTFTFNLKDGETYLLEEVPVGTSYSIVETDYVDEKYYASVLSYEGTIMDAYEIVLPFINVYEPVEQPGDLLVLKEVIGDELGDDVEEGRSFSFEVIFENLDDPENPFVIEFDLEDGGFEVLPNRTFGTKYTVRETNSNGYLPDFEEVSGYIVGKKLDENLEYDTEVKFSDHSTEFQEQDMQIVTFYNRVPDLKELKVTKMVTGDVLKVDVDKEFEFTLVVNGEEEVFYLKDGESEVFELPIYTEYEITETDYTEEGFIQSKTDNSAGIIYQNLTEVLFVNEYIHEMFDIEGEKSWDTSFEALEFIPESIIIHLMMRNQDGGEDAIVETIEVFPEGGVWKYAFQVDKDDAYGIPYEYYVKEAEIKNFQPDYTLGDEFDIYNQYVLETVVDLPTVEKQIIGMNSSNTKFTFVLTSLDDAPMPTGVVTDKTVKMLYGEGETIFGSIKYTEEDVYKYKITEVNDELADWIYDETVYTFEVEVKLEEGKLVAYPNLNNGESLVDKAIFVNEYTGEDATDPDDEDDDDLGASHMYVEGTKTWDHGLNSSEHQPTKLVVYILGDGEVYQAIETSASKNWSYKFGVPKRNDEGEEIKYTIGEEPVDGYKGVAIGYNLYNTFDLSSLVEPDSPQTSDYSQIWIWVWGLVASTITFVYVNRRKRVLRHGRRW